MSPSRLRPLRRPGFPGAGGPRRSVWNGLIRIGLFGVCLLMASLTAEAAKIGDLTQTRWTEQAWRFVSLADPAVRYACLGTVLLGIVCGLLGSFLVVRRMALLGDALSHAVLPGVALGFLWNLEKDPVAVFIGALVAGLAGSATVSLLTRTTRLKEDTALGMVLASFFGVGLCLMSMFQRLPTGNKSGIETFLFGQAAALGPGDIRVMGSVALVVVLLLVVGYKEFLLVSFDPGFARVLALPTVWFERLLVMLLAFAVVSALQAVGVVLVSAMLIIPAATASLLTDRFHRVLVWSACLGMVSSLSGAFLSFLGTRLPTGPFMVLSASLLFAMALLFSPRQGMVPRWYRQRSQKIRIDQENTLKAIYQVLEAEEFTGETVTVAALAARRRVAPEAAAVEIGSLVSAHYATLSGDRVALTPSGWQRACAIVRNHRLWELYLTHTAQIAADHVHDDAEKIEHVLGEATVRELERRLPRIDTDPHGRPIPSLASAVAGQPTSGGASDRPLGYGGRS